MNVICLENPAYHEARRDKLEPFVIRALQSFPQVTLHLAHTLPEFERALSPETRAVFYHTDGHLVPLLYRKRAPSCLYVAYSSDMIFVLEAARGTVNGIYREGLQSAGFERLIGRGSQVRDICRELFG
jgi:hypothetical protein